jgi:Txe/YoeB family toxin of toxin-antitoxin system
MNHLSGVDRLVNRFSITRHGQSKANARGIIVNCIANDRRGDEGIGKPEPLKHGFQGYWSRRITDEHRLVCKVIQDEIRIAACRYHYER